VKGRGAGCWSPREGRRGGDFKVLTEEGLGSEEAAFGVQACKCGQLIQTSPFKEERFQLVVSFVPFLPPLTLPWSLMPTYFW